MSYSPQKLEILLNTNTPHRQIAKELGCSKGTIYAYVKKHPELRRKIDIAWDAVDDFFQDHGFMSTVRKFNLTPWSLYNAIVKGYLKSEQLLKRAK